MPEISVIIDNYNYAEYLSEAIDSVLSQEFKDFELIIVDDGSTDLSREIINSYTDTRIIRIFKQNGGQTSAFNAGMAIASGNIVAFLDSDDYWYPDKLKIIFEAHKNGAQIVQHYLSENGENLYREIAKSVDWSDALVRYGYMYQHSPTSALSFLRELIIPFFPLIDEQNMRGYSDGCILMLAMTKAKVTCLDINCGYYRVHDRNLNANHTDSGQKLKDISVRQREYVNKQLAHCKLSILPYDNGQYIRYLLSNINFGEKPIVVFGTGNSGKQVERILIERGLSVWGFANSLGYEAASPDELCSNLNAFGMIIVASSTQKPIIDLLISKGINIDRIVTLDI